MCTLLYKLLLSGFGCFGLAHAQSLTPQVIASAGGFAEPGKNNISFTIGQPIATLLSAGAGSISQGFQQAAAVQLITATEPVSNELVRVFPNPSHQYLYIDSPPATLTLTDLLGRSRWQGRSYGSPLQIDVQDFAAGVYCLRIQTGNAVQSIRLLVQP